MSHLENHTNNFYQPKPNLSGMGIAGDDLEHIQSKSSGIIKKVLMHFIASEPDDAVPDSSDVLQQEEALFKPWQELALEDKYRHFTPEDEQPFPDFNLDPHRPLYRYPADLQAGPVPYADESGYNDNYPFGIERHLYREAEDEVWVDGIRARWM